MVKLKFVIRNGVLALRISAGKDRFYKRVAHLIKGEPDLKHWHADTIHGTYTDRGAETLLEKPLGETCGCAVCLGFLSYVALSEIEKAQLCMMTVPDTISVYLML